MKLCEISEVPSPEDLLDYRRDILEELLARAFGWMHAAEKALDLLDERDRERSE